MIFDPQIINGKDQENTPIIMTEVLHSEARLSRDLGNVRI